MYSSKKNVLELTALLKAYDICQVVIAPGSRNAPLIHNLTQHPFFTPHLVVDERNAGFYALGIIQKTNRPVAVCCTSGTALLNLTPAVAEAYYANLPLVIISADRSPEWIGQMDGQTISQPNALQTIVKKTVNIPEIRTKTDHWFANRLVNEALIAATEGLPGPVHINVPLSEPLFDFSETDFPEVRKISFTSGLKLVNNPRFGQIWKESKRKLIVVGQLASSPELNALLEQLVEKSNCVVLAEHISNLHSKKFISNFDVILATTHHELWNELQPDLVLSFGGHLISKRFKHFLRDNHPQHHWHLSPSPQVVDLFQSLTDLIETDSKSFLETLLPTSNPETGKAFANLWESRAQQIREPEGNLPFSDIYSLGRLLKSLPKSAALHLANSSVVRNAQLFTPSAAIPVFSCRGTNGIESSLPAAIGYAAVADELTFLAIGDLSFFYTVGAIWNIKHLNNLRVAVFNNHGGAIFHLLPGMNKSEALPQYIGAEHQNNAQKWAEAAGFSYLPAKNKEELETVLADFVRAGDKPCLLEIFTDIEINKTASEIYYNTFK